MIALGHFDVSHGQVAVFQSHLPNPFNDWRDGHVRQGFSWRPGSVSFRTIDDGCMNIEFDHSSPTPRPDAVRIISVPFTSNQSGTVEVATITQSKALTLKPGEYRLTFEHGRAEQGQMWCHLYFEPVQDPIAAQVIRADPDLDPEEPLLMEAEVAGA